MAKWLAGGHFGLHLKTIWLYILKLMVMISTENQITADLQLVTFNLTIFFWSVWSMYVQRPWTELHGSCLESWWKQSRQFGCNMQHKRWSYKPLCRRCDAIIRYRFFFHISWHHSSLMHYITMYSCLDSKMVSYVQFGICSWQSEITLHHCGLSPLQEQTYPKALNMQ